MPGNMLQCVDPLSTSLAMPVRTVQICGSTPPLPPPTHRVVKLSSYLRTYTVDTSLQWKKTSFSGNDLPQSAIPRVHYTNKQTNKQAQINFLRQSMHHPYIYRANLTTMCTCSQLCRGATALGCTLVALLACH